MSLKSENADALTVSENSEQPAHTGRLFLCAPNAALRPNHSVILRVLCGETAISYHEGHRDSQRNCRASTQDSRATDTYTDSISSRFPVLSPNCSVSTPSTFNIVTNISDSRTLFSSNFRNCPWLTPNWLPPARING